MNNMISNPYSIALLIISFLLVLFAVFNKKLRRAHNSEVKGLKENFENLTKKEQLAHKKAENWAVVILEILIWSFFILGGIFLSTKT